MIGNPAILPILYSFRRCPFAMRARLALAASQECCELREVVLRNKPAEMLAASPKGTVPVLVLADGTVLEQSLDIMLWALRRNDPEGWLKPETGSEAEVTAIISVIDGPFKHHLDRYKYASRFTGENDGAPVDAAAHRDAALSHLCEHEARLQRHAYLFGSRMTLADAACAPFVRQFAGTDEAWFARTASPRLKEWLSEILSSGIFAACMSKYPPWRSAAAGVRFPG